MFTEWARRARDAGTPQVERLRGLPSADRVYTHINNTNPMLIEGSPERALVERAGLRIGFEGMRFTL